MSQPPDSGPGAGDQPAGSGLPGGSSPGVPGPRGARAGGPRGVASAIAFGGRDSRLGTFAAGDAGDRFPPNGWLGMVLDQLSGPARTCPQATDDELMGLLGRWQ